ncbi:STAS domain-containing protein, partial [bacterium]|nr:STAS domain-containing protein [bacterium]
MTAGARAAINAMQGRLMVTMPARMSGETIRAVGDEVLERLATMPVRTLIIDMTMVESIDSREFESLARIARVVRLMGWPTVFSGMQPGVVSALMDLDVDTSGIVAVRCVDDALALDEAAVESGPPEEPVEP